jgi:hypothetical protein
MYSVYIEFKLDLDQTPAQTVLDGMAAIKAAMAAASGSDSTTSADVLIDVHVARRRLASLTTGGSRLYVKIGANTNTQFEANKIQVAVGGANFLTAVKNALTVGDSVVLSEEATSHNSEVTTAPTKSPTESPTLESPSPTNFPTRFPTPGRVTTDANAYTCNGVNDPSSSLGTLDGRCDFYYLTAGVILRGELLNGGGLSFQRDYNGTGRGYVDAFASAVASQCSTTAKHVGITKTTALSTGGTNGEDVGMTGKRYDAIRIDFGISVANRAQMDDCLHAIKSMGGFGAASADMHTHEDEEVDSKSPAGIYTHTVELNHYGDFIANFRTDAINNGVELTDADVITVELVEDTACDMTNAAPPNANNLNFATTFKGGAEPTGQFCTCDSFGENCAVPDVGGESYSCVDANTQGTSSVCIYEDKNAPQTAKSASEEHADWTDSSIAAGACLSLLGVLIVFFITYMVQCKKSKPEGTTSKVANVEDDNTGKKKKKTKKTKTKKKKKKKEKEEDEDEEEEEEEEEDEDEDDEEDEDEDEEGGMFGLV